MKRTITALIALLLAFLPVHAQRQTGRWECGPELGFNLPIVHYTQVKNNPAVGSEIKFEFRYNLDNGMDVAMELFRCVTARFNTEDYVYHEEDGDQMLYNNRMTVMMNGIAAGADYNMLRGEKISFFGGCTAGVSFNAGPIDHTSVGMVVTPRIGVEFFNRIRLCIQSRIGYRYANNIGISIGYSFGGRP